MRKIKIEDVLFWICIFMLILLALWMLHGSPTEIAAVISIILFVATSEVLLWKELFKVEKRTEQALMRLDHKMDLKFMHLENKMGGQFKDIDKELAEIKQLLKKKK